jgi:pentatricopeptide repeat protein
MVLGHVKYDRRQKALELFGHMQQECVRPDAITFVKVLNACASIVALEEGRYVHQQIIQSACECDVSVGNNLVHMYTKCGSIEDAWIVFNKMPSQDVITWNTIVLGHVNYGQG